jgi:hypothetical protein
MGQEDLGTSLLDELHDSVVRALSNKSDDFVTT